MPRSSGGDTAVLVRTHFGRGRAALNELLGNRMELSSSGATVQASDGREYLNFGGYGVFFTGAGHPRVVEAATAQLRKHALATRVFGDPVAALAAGTLAEVAPDGLSCVYFTGSGTEATEAALKLARAHGRRRLVSMVNGYHGKTFGALSLTARAQYQDPFRPLLPDVTHVPFGSIDALAAVVDDGTCLVMEPVQGEGGVVLPPPGYLAQVARLCAERGVFLVLDEVLTGLGRLGHWWGADWAGVRPDVLLVGKSLSGGVIPCAAMLATPEAFGPFAADPFVHTSTFAAAPVAMAAATAAIRVIDDEGLVERAAQLGAVLLDGLRQATAVDLVTDVRGMGLLLAVECADAGVAGELFLELLDRGVIANHSLNDNRVIRFTPPAVATDTQAERFLSIVDESCARLRAVAV